MNSPAKRMAYLAASLILLGAAALGEAADVLRESTPDLDWEKAFDRREGWIGGDAIYSAPLPGGDVLWLFADTFIGNVKEGRRQPGLAMVNNTLARHRLANDRNAPDPASASFYWGPTRDSKPTAWIKPDDLAGGGPPKDEWYWVADATVAPGPMKRDRLIIFLWRIARVGSGAFGFRSAGNALAIVDNPGVPCEKWTLRQFVIRHAIPVSGSDAKKDPETIWGSELIVDAAGGAEGPHVLIFGYLKRDKLSNDMVLARAPSASIEDMDRWRFWSGMDWSANVSDAATVAKGVTTEFSVTPLEIKGRRRWVLIHSEPWLGHRILARVADKPTGPWSQPREIYRVPNLSREKKHFTYAAKAHPELSRPDELLVTYVVNSFDFGESATNADIYRPRFIRVPTALIDPGQAE